MAGAMVLAGASSGPALAFAPAFLILTALVIVQPGLLRQLRRHGAAVRVLVDLALTERGNLSIRVRNFETNPPEGQRRRPNPVEIACIVVWQVADTARASYAVDDYVNFVRVQAESALRHLATTHPYDDPSGERTSPEASTLTSRCCCATRSATRTACPTTRGRCQGARPPAARRRGDAPAASPGAVAMRRARA